jgi:uncharacterized protein YndB with AHSA1/START domain
MVRGMEIKADVTLALPRDRVFAAYRDRLEEVSKGLPNIRSIKVLSRTEKGDDVELVNAWDGGGEIPTVARAVVSEDMLKWTDYATWHQATFTCDWKTVVGSFPDAVKSSGTNRFVEVPEGTRVEIRGTLTCDSAKISGVPRLLAGTINSAIEKLLGGQIGVNSAAVARAVGELVKKDL